MGALARQHNLPLYVDAAAERPDLPNYYLGEGATVVAYSGARTSIRWPVGCCLCVCRGLELGSDGRVPAWLRVTGAAREVPAPCPYTEDV